MFDRYSIIDLAVPMRLRAKARQKDADKGTAMPDGSYPINNDDDLKNAIHDLPRETDPAKRAAVIAHIKKRAKALKSSAVADSTSEYLNK